MNSTLPNWQRGSAIGNGPDPALRAAAAAWRTCGLSTRRWWPARSLSRLCRSSRPWGTRLTSPSAILWRTCGRRRPARRRRSLPKACFQAANSCPRPPSASANWRGSRWTDKRYELTQAVQRLARVHPRRRLNDWLQRLDDAQASLLRCVKQGARRQRLAWQKLCGAAGAGASGALAEAEARGVCPGRAPPPANRRASNWRRGGTGLGALEARLRLLGPEQVLARGYSITTDAQTGKVLARGEGSESRPALRTRLKAGEVFSRAEP